VTRLGLKRSILRLRSAIAASTLFPFANAVRTGTNLVQNLSHFDRSINPSLRSVDWCPTVLSHAADAARQPSGSSIPVAESNAPDEDDAPSEPSALIGFSDKQPHDIVDFSGLMQRLREVAAVARETLSPTAESHLGVLAVWIVSMTDPKTGLTASSPLLPTKYMKVC